MRSCMLSWDMYPGKACALRRSFATFVNGEGVAGQAMQSNPMRVAEEVEPLEGFVRILTEP